MEAAQERFCCLRKNVTFRVGRVDADFLIALMHSFEMSTDDSPTISETTSHFYFVSSQLLKRSVSKRKQKGRRMPSSGTECSRLQASETLRWAHLAKLKLLQARKKAKARQVEEQWLTEEERRWAYEDFHRREEEHQITEARQIREFEYKAEWLRLEARLEEEEERKDLESLMNPLGDFP